MTFTATGSYGPIDPDLLRRLAPLCSDLSNVKDSSPSLSLFGLDEVEQLKCLDAIDLCCSDGAVQAVEIFLSEFDAFGQTSNGIANGLALLKLPRRISADALTWLTICLITSAQQTQLTIVPILPALESADEVLRSISPYCQALLREDSDAVDYAHVISAFLRLPRTRASERFKCPGCDRRAMHSDLAGHKAPTSSPHPSWMSASAGTHERFTPFSTSTLQALSI